MLKTSPILSTSANASPTTFRYAHSPQNHPKPSTAIGRRHSSRSDPCPADPMNTSPQQRSQQYVANDSGLQGPATELHRRSSSSLSQKPLAQTTTPTRPLPAANPPAVPQPSQPSEPQVSTESQVPQSGVSPVKRRSSPPHPSAQATNSTGSPSQQTSKRAKPESPPPKILPLQYEFCPVEDMVELIAHMLGELIATNDAIRSSNGGLTRFHSRTAPGISVRDYLHRLARHATLIPPLLLAMVYYIDRLCAMYPEFTINTLTVHRFLITAATVAAKGLSDSFWNNTTYARVGGVRLAELKLLELEFLYRVDWKIVPNPEVLVAYYKGLIERTPGYALENEESEDDEDEGNQPAQSGKEEDLEP
ncbi:cyclin-domain-containing protein [Dactylonectria estremocensis]|uniref:Cyclin-domain-containing protein n=1 Tax=Dactylonectria estremocensis TaxID=1079267 RepID=A0A9P9E667_9HYPO|nr:cyclin-domain-containing protein [Dactylonectria estremocensis]